MSRETICAVATPYGVGGIAVLRISGPEAQGVALKYVRRCEAGKACFSPFKDGERLLDEVVVTYFPAPHSYTGEEVVEIACHGSLYVQQEMLRLLCRHCRLALPGEFTQRAFLNGKLDLSQAEAVADLIDSQSEAAHRLAIQQMRGGYALKLRELREQFVELASLLELELDFSDEDLEFADRNRLISLCGTLEGEVRQLTDSFRTGNALKRGIPVAIVGRPNVGKSTLLNALLGEERAIVSPIAGTTRDTVEEMLILDGIQFRFIDTAGLRHSDDLVEAQGIERSRKAIREAHIVLHLSDDGQFAPLEGAEGKPLIRLCTKQDLRGTAPSEGLAISALTGMGIAALKQALLSKVNYSPDQTLLTNARHYEAMRHILEALAQTRQGLQSGIPTDLVLIDLRDALHYLGTITGQVTTDELLGTIFSRFCVGK